MPPTLLPQARSPILLGMVSTAPSLHYTELALSSLLTHTSLIPDDTVILIDNDGSAADLAISRDPRITRIVPHQPRGFAANGNALIGEALRLRRDLVFLNNDLLFSPNWLESLLSCGDAIAIPATNREFQYALAIVKPGEDRTTSVFTLSPRMTIADVENHLHGFQALAEFHTKQNILLRVMLVLPFSCVRIPIAIAQEVGGFDESFGKGGGEDYDYCLRAIMAGFPILLAGTSLILHFGGRSTWGVENAGEIQAREDLFRSRFREKWGETLYKMIFLEQDMTSTDPELGPLFHPSHLAELIVRLLARENIPQPMISVPLGG
jgi:GT2 family glycosyltransferase